MDGSTAVTGYRGATSMWPQIEGIHPSGGTGGPGEGWRIHRELLSLDRMRKERWSPDGWDARVRLQHHGRAERAARGDTAVSNTSAATAARAVNAILSSAMEGYLQRAQELGAVEGTGGSLSLNPALKPVLQALHHVLA